MQREYGEVYGYGYLNKSTKSVATINRSSLYRNLKGRFIPAENIYIDLLLNEKDERIELNQLLNRMSCSDTLLILNKHALGDTPQFKRWWREIVIKRGLKLLIVDDQAESGVDFYSSTDFSLERKSDEEIREIEESLKHARFERLTQGRGRRFVEIGELFKDAYWAFQEFKVTPEEACQYANISRASFYNISKRYEQSEDYPKELSEHFDMVKDLPKRGTLPKGIERVIFEVEHKKNIEKTSDAIREACQKYGVEIADKDYIRYREALSPRISPKMLEKERHVDNYFAKLNKFGNRVSS